MGSKLNIYSWPPVHTWGEKKMSARLSNSSAAPCLQILKHSCFKWALGLCLWLNSCLYFEIYVVVCAGVGKEFPDVRHNERRIKFTRVGEAVRIAGWFKGRAEHFQQLAVNFYSLKTEKIPTGIMALGDWLGCYRWRVGWIFYIIWGQGTGWFWSGGPWQLLLWRLVSSRDFYPVTLEQVCKATPQYKNQQQGLPWWLSGKESACQGRRRGFNPRSAKTPTSLGATKPVHHNYWTCTLESRGCDYWSPHSLEPMLHRKRSHCNEKPVYCN